jgi:hypothetical protein
VRRVKGVHEEKEVNVYLVDIVINHNVLFENLKVTEGDLTGDVGFLIGMDIIALGDFVITQEQLPGDVREKTVFSFRMPSAKIPIDYVDELNRFKEEEKRRRKNKELRKSYQKKLKKRKHP